LDVVEVEAVVVAMAVVTEVHSTTHLHHTIPHPMRNLTTTPETHHQLLKISLLHDYGRVEQLEQRQRLQQELLWAMQQVVPVVLGHSSNQPLLRGLAIRETQVKGRRASLGWRKPGGRIHRPHHRLRLSRRHVMRVPGLGELGGDRFKFFEDWGRDICIEMLNPMKYMNLNLLGGHLSVMHLRG